MSSDRGFQSVLPIALAAAILANIMVSWTSRYWPVTVGITEFPWWFWHGLSRSAGSRFPARPSWQSRSGSGVRCNTSPHQCPSLADYAESLVWIMGAIVFILASQILCDSSGRRSFLRLILWVVTALAVAAMLQAYTSPVRVFGIFPAEASVVGTMNYKITSRR